MGLCLGFGAASGVTLGLLSMGRSTVRDRLSEKLGPANWDFSKSWASTITAVGALLGTFIGASVLPTATGPLTKVDFSILNLCFGVLSVGGPFVWSVFRTPSADPQHGVAFTGSVRAFLVATSLVSVAVSGEVFTIGVFIHESHLKAIGVTLDVLVGSFLLLVWLYCYRTTEQVISFDAEAKKEAEAAAATRKAMVGGEEAAAPLPRAAAVVYF